MSRPAGQKDPNAAAPLRAGAEILFAALILLWPLVFARRPVVFSDTDHYWNRGRALVTGAFGLDRNAQAPFDLMTQAQVLGFHVIPDPRIGATYLGARSAVYGAFLYASDRVGGPWLVAALQALLAAIALRLMWSALAPGRTRFGFPAFALALAAGTGLPFFAGFLMPDVFAGLLLLAVLVLALSPEAVAPRARGALLALVVFSSALHSTHIVIAVAALFGALVLRLARTRSFGPAARVIAAPAVAVLAGAALLAGAHALVDRAEGGPSHSPPFLEARLIADGPGRAYLRHACVTGSPYALCAFKDRPLDGSDAILWWNYPDQGVFMVSPYETRLRLEAEEPRFLRDLVAADPGGVARALAADAGLQLTRFWVDDALHDPCESVRQWWFPQSGLRALIPDAGSCGARTGLYLPAAPFFALHGLVLLLAAAVLLRAGREAGPLRDIAAASLFALVVNAAVCGALSGPFARYEARLAWVMPALALAAVARRATAAAPAGVVDAALDAARLPA